MINSAYFKKCSIAIIFFFVCCDPRSLSAGGGRLAFPCWVLLLLNCYALGGWPEGVAAQAVCPYGRAVVIFFLSAAGGAIMVGANWMEPV
jgi:hypothetical protein